MAKLVPVTVSFLLFTYGMVVFMQANTLAMVASNVQQKYDFSVPMYLRKALLNIDAPPKNISLEFVHITKTGGTSIEKAACKQGIAWGMYRFPPRNANPECPFQWTMTRQLREGNLWHLPPNDMVPNPYANSNLFSIVRHPYLRAVSEYHCPWTGYKGDDYQDPRVMNKWLRNKMASNFDNGVSFLPQYKYMHQGAAQHIIFHEHIRNDFNRLMKYYDLPIVLASGVNKARHAAPSVLDLEDSTIEMINEYSKRDFDVFGYKMAYAM